MPLFGRLISSYRQHLKAQARKETPPRYIIEEPGDFLHVPEDRLDICLSELKTCIITLNEMVGQGLLTGDSANVSIRRFVWIDDGKTDGKLTVKAI
jgi:hypothetical protein